MVRFKILSGLGFVFFLGLGLSAVIGDSQATHGVANHIAAGKAVYETTCVACHGVKGKGEIPGVPDLTNKKGPLAKSDEELFINIKEGFESPGSFMAMPPLGGNLDLTDQDVRDVIEYLRAEFEKK